MVANQELASYFEYALETNCLMLCRNARWDCFGEQGWGRLDTSLASPQILQGRMTTPQTYQRRGSRIDPVVVVIVLCSTKFNAIVSLNLIMMARAKISQQNASTSSTREYFFYPFQKSSLIPRETGAPNVKFGKISVRKTIEI